MVRFIRLIFHSLCLGISYKKIRAVSQKDIETQKDVMSIFPQLVFLRKKRATVVAEVVVQAFLKNEKHWLLSPCGFRYISEINNKLYDIDSHIRQCFINSIIDGIIRFNSNLSIPLLGILSLNENGYLREAAVHALACYKSPKIIPYILLRTKDWVGCIQQAALEILEDGLVQFSPIEFLKNYRLIIHMRYHDKPDLWILYGMDADKIKNFSAIQDQRVRGFNKICDFLRKEENRDVLFSYLNGGGARETLFYFAINADVLFQEERFLRFVLGSHHHEIKVFYLKRAERENFFDLSFLNFVHSKMVDLRYFSLRTIPKNQRLQYKDYFERALLDKSLKIREYARFVLLDMNKSILGLL